MSSPPIAELSQRLQSALDSNYNVVDMATVIEVIGVLERAKITKEQLETTRLAKHINQLRRKTDDHMSKRLKNLLRKWREMVIPIVVASTSTSSAPAILLPPQQRPQLNNNNNNHHHQHNNHNHNHSNSTSSLLLHRQTINHTSPALSNGGGGGGRSQPIPSVQRPTSATAKPPLVQQSPNRPAATARPVSFTNLISQAEANQQHIHRKRPSTNLSPSATSAITQLPRIPKRQRNNNDPLHLFGNNTQQPPSQLFQVVHSIDDDDDDDTNSLHLLHDQDAIDDVVDANSNNSKRRRFNGLAPSPPPCSSSFGIPSDSDSMSQLGLSTTATTMMSKPKRESSNNSSKKEHKKDKKPHRNRDRSQTAPNSSSSKPNNNNNNHLAISSSVATAPATSSFFDAAPNSLSSESSLLFGGPRPTKQPPAAGNHQPHPPPVPPPQNQSQAPLRGAPLRKHQSSELTFSGKFTKSISSDPTPTAIINIDSSSCSSSSSSSSFSNGAMTNTTNINSRPAGPPPLPLSPSKGRAFASVSSTCSSSSSSAAAVITPAANASLHRSSSPHYHIMRIMDSSSDSSTLGLIDPTIQGHLLSGGESCSSLPLPPHLLPTSTTTSPLLGAHPPAPPPSTIHPEAMTSVATVSSPAKKQQQQQQQQRGRKKGAAPSNGGASLSRQVTPTGGSSATATHPFATSLLGLKNQIDSMRVGQNKVKTTKELLADLQVMRRQDVTSGEPVLGTSSSATSSPVLGGGRRSRGDHSQSTSESDSSSNDDVRSTTATPVSLSGAAPGATVDVPPTVATGGGGSLDVAAQRNVELEIAELRAQLPPIDREAARRTEAAIAADPSPVCTCTVVEVAPPAVAEAVATEVEGKKHEDIVVVIVEHPKAAAAAAPLPPPPSPPPPVIVAAPAVKKAPVRSIFDLDYDEDEDPLLQYKAAALLHSERQLLPSPPPPEAPPTTVSEPETPPAAVAAPQQPPPPPPPPVPPPPPPAINPLDLLPRLEVIEDPDCAARKHFVDDKNRITAFHVCELHNAYVANVNGNWDDRTAPGPFDQEEEKEEAAAEVPPLKTTPVLYDRVVPSYNHLCLDRIPKNLRHMTIGSGGAPAGDKKKKLKLKKIKKNKKKKYVAKKNGKAKKKEEEPQLVVEAQPKPASADVVAVELPKPKPPKLSKLIKYKIEGGANPVQQPSTKLILKLSRQLTVDESNNEEEDDEDEDEDSEYGEDCDEEEEEEEEEDEDEDEDDFVEVNSEQRPHGFDCSDDMALLEPPQPMDNGEMVSLVIENNNHINPVDGGNEATGQRSEEHEGVAPVKCEAYQMPANVRGLEHRGEGDDNEGDDEVPRRNGGNHGERDGGAPPAGAGGGDDDDDDDDDDGFSSSSSTDDSSDTSSEDDEEEEEDDEEPVVGNNAEENNNNNNNNQRLPTSNNFLLPSFNHLDATNATGRRPFVPQYSPRRIGVAAAAPAPPLSAPSPSSIYQRLQVVEASAVLVTSEHPDGISRYREWHEVVMRRSYNNELLTILPYVVID